jgi:C1A family cysteine protease
MFTPVITDFPPEHLVEKPPSIYDQGQTSMCVAYSLAALKEQHEYKERGTRMRYSPGFIYGNRKPTDYQGEGMHPREALANLVESGVCTYEELLGTGPYSACKAWVEWLPRRVREKAKDQRILSYVRAYTDNEIKTMLTTMGPVALTIAVYPSFFHPPGGIVSVVQPDESIQGYHEMLIVGWKRIKGKEYWVVHNSWGTAWGDAGRCYIPAGYQGITECWGVTDMGAAMNRDIEMDCTPVIIPPGRITVPVRYIVEALGGTAKWDNDSKTATFIVPSNGKTVTFELQYGSKILKIRS